jgi:hypothetical protein
MFRKQDPYSYTQFQTLYINKESTPKPIGLIALEYQVALYNDVQVLNEGSVTQSNTQQFVLKCTQRILLQNADTSLSPILPEPPEKYETYIDYPVLFKAGINIPTTGLALELLDYSPHTVNTSVQQSTSHADGSQTGTGTTTSNTTGTSNSQSSTYGVTVTAGDTFSGVAASYEYSTSSTHEQSNTNEKSSSASASKDSSASASMSVKNWGAYAMD